MSDGLRIAVLTGGAHNFLPAIQAAYEGGRSLEEVVKRAVISVVVSDDPESGTMVAAVDAGVPTSVLNHDGPSIPTKVLLNVLLACRINFLIVAGYTGGVSWEVIRTLGRFLDVSEAVPLPLEIDEQEGEDND